MENHQVGHIVQPRSQVFSCINKLFYAYILRPVIDYFQALYTTMHRTKENLLTN